MLTKLVDWLIAFAKRNPYSHIGDYMERYWIVAYGKWWAFDVALRVHHILRSDMDRAFHDHPWPYISVILRGGYTEVKPVFESGIYVGDTRRYYGAGSVLFRRAKAWHRLEVETGQTTWTLFLTGRYQQRWGFLVKPEYKVYWKDFA